MACILIFINKYPVSLKSYYDPMGNNSCIKQLNFPPNPPKPPKVEPPVDSGSGRWPFGRGGTGFSRGSLGFASSVNITTNHD